MVPGSTDLEGQGQSPDITPSPYQLNWNSAKPFSLVLPFEIRRLEEVIHATVLCKQSQPVATQEGAHDHSSADGAPGCAPAWPPSPHSEEQQYYTHFASGGTAATPGPVTGGSGLKALPATKKFSVTQEFHLGIYPKGITRQRSPRNEQRTITSHQMANYHYW